MFWDQCHVVMYNIQAVFKLFAYLDWTKVQKRKKNKLFARKNEEKKTVNAFNGNQMKNNKLNVCMCI